MNNINENELLDEIITILMAALSIAGVKDDSMQEALDAYENALNNISDDADYDYKAICKIIMDLKKTRGELFN